MHRTQVERFAPVSQPNQYVSSYAYDTLLDYLYYTYKEYQTKGATLTALDCKHMLTFNESRFIGPTSPNHLFSCSYPT